MGYLLMYDAVDVGNVPAGADYAGVYVNGHYANEAAMRARFPHAKFLTITVSMDNTADACDCEVGDLTVAEAEEWVRWRLAAGVHRPCVYASQDRWENQGLHAALTPYGSKIRRWIASYPGSGPNVPPGYDAHQFASSEYDASVCLPDFFATSVTPSGVARALLEVELENLSWKLTPEPGVGETVWRQREVYASLEVQVGIGGKLAGRWRSRPLPFNAAPLGS
jgi:hypothetical protein